MRILITGAAGFIGSGLATRLIETTDGTDILGIDSLNDYYDPMIKEYRLGQIGAAAAAHPSSSWEFVKGNIADKELVDGIFKRFRDRKSVV